MRLLNRYLFNNLLKPMIYLLMAFSLLFIIGDLMDNASDFMAAGTGALGLAYYYALWLPSMVIRIVPICLLLAVLYSLSSLTRHNEITAMRATGISIYRIVRPYMLMGVICMLFTAIVNEYTGPKFAYRADQFVQNQQFEDERVYYEQIYFENPTSRHSWRIKKFDTRTYSMQGITLLKMREDGSDAVKIFAERGRWLDNRWWFEDGSIQQFDELNNIAGPPEPFQVLEMRKLPEVPEDFMGEIKDPSQQSSMELWKYIQTHRHLDSIAKDKVDLHHKLSEPVVCLIIILIGIPVGAHTGRKGALAGIMLALGMFFSFYATQLFMEYLGKREFITFWTSPLSQIGHFDDALKGTYFWLGPWHNTVNVIGSFNFAPWIGPWGAVIAFLCIGVFMTHRMR